MGWPLPLYINLSIYLSIYLSISIYIYIYTFKFKHYLSTYLSIYIYIYLFVFIYIGPRSRGTHGRDFWRPLGNCGYGFVAVGNLLACRCILLIYVAVSRGLKFILEQPDGSALPLHPRWEELLGHVQALWMEEPTNILGMGCSI